MEATIRADEAKLRAISARIGQRIERIEKAMQAISEQVRMSADFWEGEASEIHRKKFTAVETDTRQTITKLKTHPRHLLEMAGVYREGENTAQGMTQALSGHVIS